MNAPLSLPFLASPPDAPPPGSTAARAAGGADPVAPTPSPTSRGLIVKVTGRPGTWTVLAVHGEAVELQSNDGRGFASVKLGDVGRV